MGTEKRELRGLLESTILEEKEEGLVEAEERE